MKGEAREVKSTVHTIFLQLSIQLKKEELKSVLFEAVTDMWCIFCDQWN